MVLIDRPHMLSMIDGFIVHIHGHVSRRPWQYTVRNGLDSFICVPSTENKSMSCENKLMFLLCSSRFKKIVCV